MPLVHLAAPEELGRLHPDDRTVVILPVAATEAHGPHLPVTTDCDIARGHLGALGSHIDDATDVAVLPIEPIGASQEHCRFAGTESWPVDALVKRWFGVAEVVRGAGARRLVIVSSHGGNSAAVDTVILRARAELDMLAVGTAWLRFGSPEGLYSEREKRFGIHGGDIETSLMLHYWPGKVDMARAADFASRLEALEPGMTHLRAYGPHRFGWLSSDLNAMGVVGDASAASAAKGAAHADHILSGFAGLVDDVARFDLDWLA